MDDAQHEDVKRNAYECKVRTKRLRVQWYRDNDRPFTRRMDRHRPDATPTT